MEKFCEKSWQFQKGLDEDKNALDNYMKAWGLGIVYRTMMSKSNPIIRFKESKKEPGKYYLITRSARSGLMVKRFVLGPFEINGPAVSDPRADNKIFKTKLSLSEDGKVMSQIAEHETLPVSTTTREILEDGSMKVIAECGGKVVTRIYVPEDHVDSKEDEEL